jgi:hypothetical protein
MMVGRWEWARTPGRTEEKKGNGNGNGSQSDGIFGVCVGSGGNTNYWIQVSCFLPCVFSFLFHLSFLTLYWHALTLRSGFQSACNARDSRHWINLGKFNFSFPVQFSRCLVARLVAGFCFSNPVFDFIRYF